MAIENEYKGFERYGGSKSVELPDGSHTTVGKLNTLNGTAMLAWSLHRYTKVLRLSINELVLMELYLIRQWTEDKTVWLSMEKWAKQLGIHRTSLSRARVKLEQKGYLISVKKRQFGITEYQVTGILYALCLCAMCDPSGKFIKEYGYSVSEARAHAYMDGWGHYFDLDFEALSQLGP